MSFIVIHIEISISCRGYPSWSTVVVLTSNKKRGKAFLMYSTSISANVAQLFGLLLASILRETNSTSQREQRKLQSSRALASKSSGRYSYILAIDVHACTLYS